MGDMMGKKTTLYGAAITEAVDNTAAPVDAVYRLQYVFYIVTIDLQYYFGSHPSDELHRHRNFFSLSRRMMVRSYFPTNGFCVLLSALYRPV